MSREKSQLGISLNKYLSSRGICSRRQADKWIEAGRVKINNQVAKRGNRVMEADEVYLDNNKIKDVPKRVYLAFHKPPGITSTTDLSDKDNIIEYIGYPERIFPIGRLDKASSGLILLTNDGDAVNPLLRSENAHEKEYIVKVNRPLTNSFLKKMASGVPILGTITKKCRVEKCTNYIFKIVLTQGMNRQIRRMCEYLDYKVLTLKRVRVKHIHLNDLKVGQWRYLSPQEIKKLPK